METILQKIFDINYYLPWSDDTQLEKTTVFLKLEEATMALRPNTKYHIRYEAFSCALKLISVQVLKDDQYEIGGLSSVSNELRKNIERLQWEEVCILSNYFDLYRNLKTEETEEFYFLTADANERVSFDTVVSQVALCLTMEIEIEQTRMHGFLKHGLSKEFWYDVYGADDKYNKERVDHILSSIFQMS